MSKTNHIQERINRLKRQIEANKEAISNVYLRKYYNFQYQARVQARTILLERIVDQLTLKTQ